MNKTATRPKFSWEDIKDFCDSLTDEQDALTREMVTRISDKWSLWTMSVLAESPQPMRFSRILDHVITRKVFAEVPPRVEYALTPIGFEMLDNITPLWLWVAKRVKRFQDARDKFDGR